MGWYIWPSEGPEPLRENEKNECNYCQKPIEPDTKFYFEQSGVAHCLCLWKHKEEAI